ncbi:MAG: HEAT repeat domain-containing protein [Coriobacteriia bacterium]|nr:HEAT repeat domain-containing protein [Coriobacteriia bacterium]
MSAPDLATLRSVETVVRALTTTTKTLRLYPASSPIPRQSAAAACSALAELLAVEPVIPLTVAREGFTFGGMSVASVGSSELADLLVAHGVAELDILPGCSEEDLTTALTIVLEPPDTLRERGGFGAALAAAGIECVRASDVSLTVIEFEAIAPDGDVDEFLRQLATDPEKLALWLQSVVKGDPSALEEGLSEMLSTVGPDDFDRLVESLTAAFLAQDASGRDAILGIAASCDDDLNDLVAGVFSQIGSGDLAASLVGGLYGKNMLSVSSMITNLPIGQRLDEIMAEIEPMLAQAGHSAKELTFLEHMMGVRTAKEPEKPLFVRAPDYAKVAKIAEVRPDEVAAVRSEVQRSLSHVSARSVATMLSLLDQQEDFDLYCKTLDGLVSLAPTLFEQRDLDLATRVISELVARESRTDLPWPELANRLHSALARATDRRAMGALLHAVMDDAALVHTARNIVLKCGEQAQTALLEEALTLRDHDGLELAGQILGRRLTDLLVSFAAKAQWFQLAPIAQRLASETEPRATQALETLVRRADAQSRREVTKGLSKSGSPNALSHLRVLMHDGNTEVAVSAIRAIGASKTPGATGALSDLLGEIDADGKDFALTREIIDALMRSADDHASNVLTRLATRKSLIKRGHFTEVSALAQQALDGRTTGGAR